MLREEEYPHEEDYDVADGYVEFQFGDSGYEDVQLVEALLKAVMT